MKFQAQSGTILPSAILTNRFTGRVGSLPSLAAILVSAQSDMVVFRATNLECGVEVSFPAKVSQDGVVAIPGSTLAGFLQNNASAKNISAELSGGVLLVQTERAKASLKTLPVDEFPTLPRVSAEKSFTVKAVDFVRLLRSILFCASVSAVKPELQGIFLSGEAGKLTGVATDSFRLAEKTVPLKSKGSVPAILFPARNASELVRILEGVTGDVELYFNQNQLSVQIENVYYTSRLIDGSFPNYQQIIPKEFAAEAVALREEFLSGLKSLQLFTDKFLQATLKIDPKSKSLELSSRNADVGEQTITLPAAASGGILQMNFNNRYLADGAAAVSGDNIRLSLAGVGKPLLMKDTSDDSYLYLAMPMNR